MSAPYTPQMIAPSAPGQLSNKRGSNTGADAIGIQSKQSNPKGGFQKLSLMRILARRTAVSGNPMTPQLYWDSGWMGDQPASQLLTVGKTACGGNATAVYNGRMYFMPADGTLQSAQCQGPAIGTWRNENPLAGFAGISPYQSNTTGRQPANQSGVLPGELLPLPTVYSMTIVANRLYCIATAVQPISTQATLYFTTINGDGTVGAWAVVPGGIIIQSDATWKQAGCLGGWDGTSATGFIVLWNTALNVTTVTVNISDGSITAAAVDSTRIQTVHRDNYAFAFIGPSNVAGTYDIIFIGGPATAASAVCDKATINPSTGLSIGAFAAGAALPAAKCFGSGMALQDGNVYYMGGSTTTLAANATNAVYYNTSQRIDAGTAWTTSAKTLTVNMWKGGGAVGSNDLDVQTEVSGLAPVVCYIGGENASAVAQSLVYTAAVNQAASPHDVQNFFSLGAGGPLTAAELGTGGTRTDNQDGTQTFNANYGAQGNQAGVNCGSVRVAGGFTDGDQVTITVVHCSQEGDYSPPAVTVIKIGQPPTISGIAPTGIADGRPLLSFNFIPGAGGGPELSYRIQLQDLSAVVIFDTGVRYDGANSAQSLCAPYLVNVFQYKIFVDVVATDTPMAGSTASASANITTTAATLTPPGTPNSLVVTPNHALGSMTLTWTNVAPAGTIPGNRVYYRKTGTTPWFLLLDLGAVFSAATVADRIALATGYDFAVSRIDLNNHAESALSNIVTNKIIDPVQGGYSVDLHVQGSINDQSGPSAHRVGLLAQDTPDVKSKIDMRTSLPFQQLAPVARMGVANYLEISFSNFIQDLTHLKALQDVINTAYAGGVIIYRDGFGAMVACAPQAENGVVYKPPLYREVDLNLVQIPDNLVGSASGWSVAQGSAQGYQSQLYGSAIPLDPSELIL